MKRNFLPVFLCLLLSVVSSAQKTQNALLWKITGKGLEKPSYLFGTFHFLTNSFVDTMQAVKKAYKETEVVAGELIIDSTIQAPMMEASVLKGTTLKAITPDTEFAKTAEWFKKEAGLDLMQLNQFNPMTVMTAAMAITQQKYFPNVPGQIQLDTYFRELAKKDGKQILGLETIDIQINALFKQLSLSRQVEILDVVFSQQSDFRSAVMVMNDAYIRNDLEALQKLMYTSTYKPEEIKVLLDDRNYRWMAQLPALMQKHSMFVAVGALHLTGESGLVNQLRKKGFTLTPVNLKNSE